MWCDKIIYFFFFFLNICSCVGVKLRASVRKGLGEHGYLLPLGFAALPSQRCFWQEISSARQLPLSVSDKNSVSKNMIYVAGRSSRITPVWTRFTFGLVGLFFLSAWLHGKTQSNRAGSGTFYLKCYFLWVCNNIAFTPILAVKPSNYKLNTVTCMVKKQMHL